MALFNVNYAEEEVFDANNFISSIKNHEVLALAPLRLHFVTSGRWTIVGYTDVIDLDIPMFKIEVYGSAEDGNDFASVVLIDFGYNYYRMAKESETDKVRNYFTSGPIYFEDILIHKFLDNTLLNNASSNYFIKWEKNQITESDMKKNHNLYQPWTGFGSEYK